MYQPSTDRNYGSGPTTTPAIVAELQSPVDTNETIKRMEGMYAVERPDMELLFRGADSGLTRTDAFAVRFKEPRVSLELVNLVAGGLTGPLRNVDGPVYIDGPFNTTGPVGENWGSAELVIESMKDDGTL